jgi:hypothetical protein
MMKLEPKHPFELGDMISEPDPVYKIPVPPHRHVVAEGWWGAVKLFLWRLLDGEL